MKILSVVKAGIFTAAWLFLGTGAHAAHNAEADQFERIVRATVEPVMRQHDIPGMAVGLTVGGRQYVFNYGVAARESGEKVSDDTIFEIGSVSKVFTATLAAYAQARGALNLADNASSYLPALAGSSFDKISLLDLGTYTAGGLPLQFPDGITDQDQMVAYYRSWNPVYTARTHRQYSNPSVGLFGHLAARSLDAPFDHLMEQQIFPRLGLAHTYVRVPQERMTDYAYGHSKDGAPIRVTPGILDSEAYGVKTTASDLIRFVEANMSGSGLDETLQRAIAATHTGYYRIGDMVQSLGWEIYAPPVSLDRLLEGNSSEMAFTALEARRLSPPVSLQEGALINKTGSTSGFGAYVAFVPSRDLGIVLLANRNYPNPDRVKTAYRILRAVDPDAMVLEK